MYNNNNNNNNNHHHHHHRRHHPIHVLFVVIQIMTSVITLLIGDNSVMHVVILQEIFVTNYTKIRAVYSNVFQALCSVCVRYGVCLTNFDMSIESGHLVDKAVP